MQTLAVCGKIPPFPAPRRKRARTARPPVPCQESRLPGCEGGHGPRRAPVSALPRPIPDGPPPISGANKGENAFRPLRPPPGGLEGRSPPKCNRIARLCPVVQTSRRALTAPAARFTPSQISAFCALAARSPCICSRLQVALPPSVASARWAHASFRCTFGSLWAFGPTAHRADASLRCRAGGEFAPKAQTFLTPSAARRAGGEVGGRRNSPAEKIAEGELFRRSR